MIRGLPIRKRTALGDDRPLSLRSTAPTSSFMNSISPNALTPRLTVRSNSENEIESLAARPISVMSGRPMDCSTTETTASKGLGETKPSESSSRAFTAKRDGCVGH